MDSEEAWDAFLAKYRDDGWAENSEGYQTLLEECGDNLVAGLLACLEHPDPEFRAVGASMLATRRPHSPEMIEALAPLLHDPHPLVRLKTLHSLKEFGDLALPLQDQLYEIVHTEQGADDQVPRILAMDVLLHIAFDDWEQELVPELIAAATSRTGDLAEYLAVRCLAEVHGHELPDEDREVRGDDGA